MKINKNNNKGNITVEAAIIFPVIFFCIIAVMFAGIFLYQKVLLQSLANRSVERGAATWNNHHREISSGRFDVDKLADGGLYWRIIDFNKGKKEENLNNYIKDRMNTYSILKGTHQIAKIDLKNYIVYRKLFVTVEGRYKNPAASIMKIFGYDEYITVSVTTQSIINDPVEFVRNTDFIMNLVEDLEEKNPTVANIGNNMREIMTKMNESLTKVFELGK